MNTVHKITSVVLFLVVALGLGACGSGGTGYVTTQGQPVAPTKSATDLDKERMSTEQALVGTYSAFSKKLQDGRTVQCVGYVGYNSGTLDCDFANAK